MTEQALQLASKHLNRQDKSAEDEDTFIVWEWSVFPLEEECPQIKIGDV
jgi:hypothetical protein